MQRSRQRSQKVLALPYRSSLRFSCAGASLDVPALAQITLLHFRHKEACGGDYARNKGESKTILLPFGGSANATTGKTGSGTCTLHSFTCWSVHHFTLNNCPPARCSTKSLATSPFGLRAGKC